MYRCPGCRTRRLRWKRIAEHMQETGHKVCNCEGYHYHHRPGSPCCTHHPRHILNRAIREGSDPRSPF